ncbi:TPA: hypothetical protein ACG5SI_005113, partial [Escherichia coli]
VFSRIIKVRLPFSNLFFGIRCFMKEGAGIKAGHRNANINADYRLLELIVINQHKPLTIKQILINKILANTITALTTLQFAFSISYRCQTILFHML